MHAGQSKKVAEHQHGHRRAGREGRGEYGQQGQQPGVGPATGVAPLRLGGRRDRGEVRAVLVLRRGRRLLGVRERPYPQPACGQTGGIGAQDGTDLRGVQRPVQYGLEVRPVLGAKAVLPGWERI
ncbi:hypothetical protein [Streptomyces ipomoeae]|uniref:hypothetical protein n=1 Tax=Streptomyces ipomoeae TaxID=103232 RepID=UPI0029B1CA63|nr:hypothetical protein [Streptomyces ipomoeae]MDX2700797.1 hypothetical protein [Streptomyces ipomoeae]